MLRQHLSDRLGCLLVLMGSSLIFANGFRKVRAHQQGLAHAVAVPEEILRTNLLPKVASGAGIVGHYPIQVLLHEAPNPFVHAGFLGRVGHGGDGPKPGSVVLWTTPGARERRALGDQELRLNQHVDAIGIALMLRLLQRLDPFLHLLIRLWEGLGLKVGIHTQRPIPGPCKVVISSRPSVVIRRGNDLTSALHIQIQLEELHHLVQLSI
mmetsp:Transcript_46989/g.102268  ORF Transcript_46989/g.102268 Transcript_46989/m.102268 type:complete len:210 (-) Transcript_46989:306-935(-)